MDSAMLLHLTPTMSSSIVHFNDSTVNLVHGSQTNNYTTIHNNTSMFEFLLGGIYGAEVFFQL
jgi:hypothetical protein